MPFSMLQQSIYFVNHGGLIHKIETIGLPEVLINLVSSHLANYLFTSKFRCSESVLGRLLFLVYINGFAAVVPDEVEIKMFPDDCIIH